MYVDEVQDFTQAEISLLLLLVGHPDNLFLTGDIAQTINMGVSFRFEEVRGVIYNICDDKTRKNVDMKGKNYLNLLSFNHLKLLLFNHLKLLLFNHLKLLFLFNHLKILLLLFNHLKLLLLFNHLIII